MTPAPSRSVSCCVPALEPHLAAAFTRADGNEPTLDAAYAEHGNELFSVDNKAGKILDLLDLTRYRLARALLPTFDLLVVDEAHKLKNRETKRALSLSHALRQRFRNALFLTATPSSSASTSCVRSSRSSPSPRPRLPTCASAPSTC
ncbi:hypothetical protein [Nannocystis pusilla]|uniref:hypothetical protein n=1 Tax=Nannocystis pusilla TaxID=889268 RepID=UPI003B7BD9A0